MCQLIDELFSINVATDSAKICCVQREMISQLTETDRGGIKVWTDRSPHSFNWRAPHMIIEFTLDRIDFELKSFFSPSQLIQRVHVHPCVQCVYDILLFSFCMWNPPKHLPFEWIKASSQRNWFTIDKELKIDS